MPDQPQLMGAEQRFPCCSNNQHAIDVNTGMVFTSALLTGRRKGMEANYAIQNSRYWFSSYKKSSSTQGSCHARRKHAYVWLIHRTDIH